MKVYTYKNCSTCKNATKFLKQKEIQFEEIAIRDNPPSIKELQMMLKFQNHQIKKMFNTSGVDYRELKIKDKVDTLSETELLELLHSNGNLIKRPFLISKEVGLVGFKEEEWNKI